MIGSRHQKSGFFWVSLSKRQCLIIVRVKDRGGEAEVSRATWDKGAEGVHEGHFHTPAWMVVRRGRRQSICQPALHMSQRSILS